jgi:glucose-1-phosphate cytidylyltransferase
MTGGRVKRVQEFIGKEPFMLTYGDGLSNVDIPKLLEFHKSHKKILTLTSVQPEGRFGALTLGTDDQVHSFIEKPSGDGAWINGGFFVCEPQVFDYIKGGDSTIFEREPMENIAKDGQLYAYKHTGFWKPMDTLRDKTQLEELIANNKAPWITWKQ